MADVTFTEALDKYRDAVSAKALRRERRGRASITLDEAEAESRAAVYLVRLQERPAPDLLEALEAMLANYEELHTVFDLGDCDAAELARTAIQKAKS